MRTLLFYASLPFITLLAIRRPFWGLMIYLSANIIRPEMLFWGGHTGAIIFRVSIGATLLGFLIYGENKSLPLIRKEFYLVLWGWIAVKASLFFSSYALHPKAAYYSEEFLKLCVLAWLVIGILNKHDFLLKSPKILLLFASLLSLWGWDQSFRGNERLEGLGGEAFGDSNGVAAFGVLFLPLALHLFLGETRKKWKILYFISFLLIGGMIVFTQSRGGFLGVVLALLYLFWRTPRKKKLAKILIVGVLLISPFAGTAYINRIKTIEADEEHRDFSSGSRLVLWHAGLLVFIDHPVFGVGLLNYPRAKIPYEDKLVGKYDEALLDYSFQGYKVGHSTWICQILAEGGLFLAIPYFWFIFNFFNRARKQHRKVRKKTNNDEIYITELYSILIGLEAGVFGYCVSLSFIDGLISPFLVIQILIGTQILRYLELEKIHPQHGIQPQEAAIE